MNRRFRATPLPVAGAPAALDAAASFHAVRVLRLGVGAPLVLFDGAGAEVDAVVRAVDGGVVVAEAVGPPRAPAARADVVLLVGLPKGPSMDLAVRMATEAGVTHVVPVVARRSVATGDRADRWRRIAAAAARQCCRPDDPTIDEPSSLADALGRVTTPERWIALPTDGPPPAPNAAGAALLVGPEGGFDPAEIALAHTHGFAPISLGPFVLRVETAAAIGVARLASR